MILLSCVLYFALAATVFVCVPNIIIIVIIIKYFDAQSVNNTHKKL